MIVDNGWALKDHLSGEHRLLILRAEGPSRLSWSALDLEGGSIKGLSSYSDSWPIRCSAIVPGQTEILYAETSGLWRLNWQTGDAAPFLKLDLDQNHLVGLWIEPSNGRPYFVVSKRTAPLSIMMESLKKQGVAEERGDGPGELFVIESAIGAPRVLLEIDPSTILSSLVVAESTLYALTFKHELLRIDLRSGESRIAGMLPVIAEGLSAGSRGELLVSGALGTDDSGIYLFDHSGRMIRRLSNFGYRPSMSPDRSTIAILVPNGICLTSGSDSFNQIVTLEGSPAKKSLPSDAPMFEESCKIKWCACGAHFAVIIPRAFAASEKWPESDCSLLVADVAAKQIAIYNVRPFDYLWAS